jgi:hypothetical protein
VYLVGDLKIYAQMASREGMSSYWSMWCTLHPSEWRTFQENPGCVPEEEKRLWTIDLHNETLEKIKSGELKEGREKKCVVAEPICSLIEPCNLISPIYTSKLESLTCFSRTFMVLWRNKWG